MYRDGSLVGTSISLDFFRLGSLSDEESSVRLLYDEPEEVREAASESLTCVAGCTTVMTGESGTGVLVQNTVVTGVVVTVMVDVVAAATHGIIKSIVGIEGPGEAGTVGAKPGGGGGLEDGVTVVESRPFVDCIERTGSGSASTEPNSCVIFHERGVYRFLSSSVA